MTSSETNIAHLQKTRFLSDPFSIGYAFYPLLFIMRVHLQLSEMQLLTLGSHSDSV